MEWIVKMNDTIKYILTGINLAVSLVSKIKNIK